ncbi:MAG TPA: flavodoxin domain-containing protein [Streptosporangiaceae bacterium]
MASRPALSRAEGGSGLNVLVAYATKHGSTRQVAEAVTEVMQERGAQVTLRPARAVRESAARFDLVVLGAPLNSGRWHRDAGYGWRAGRTRARQMTTRRCRTARM